MSICPLTWFDCETTIICNERKLCKKLVVAPIDLIANNIKPALHFIGFTNTKQLWLATEAFGKPDFIHRTYDVRCLTDIVIGYDKVIFAQYENQKPCEYAFDDSNQPNDPTSNERKGN